MALKLIKVAKEFNVGLHTIVETLHSKGFTHVEDKPTAEITDEMLVVLKKEFQKDLAIKQEADKLARPVLKKDGQILIRQGRHPVVEQLLAGGAEPFVPNDLKLGGEAGTGLCTLLFAKDGTGLLDPLLDGLYDGLPAGFP